MAQLTLYLDAETEAAVRRAADEAGVSLSRWVANLLRDQTRQTWPESVRQLAGAWADASTAEELRVPSASDVPREPM